MKAVVIAALIASPVVAQDGREASERAHAIALATFQPDKALADAMANFDRQFDAGFARSARGRTFTAAQRARLDRVKAMGRDEMERQFRSDALPTTMRQIEQEYREHYDVAELRLIAAFWESPAGLALTAEAQRASLRGLPVTPPPAFATPIAAYFASPVGRKEAGRRAEAQSRVAAAMTAAIGRVQTKTQAAIAAATTTP